MPRRTPGRSRAGIADRISRDGKLFFSGAFSALPVVGGAEDAKRLDSAGKYGTERQDCRGRLCAADRGDGYAGQGEIPDGLTVDGLPGAVNYRAKPALRVNSSGLCRMHPHFGGSLKAGLRRDACHDK